MPVYAFPQDVSRFVLPAELGLARLVRRGRAQTATYFDTFDGRLHRRGLHLVRTRDGLSLHQADSGEALHTTRPGSSPDRKRWWELLPGPLRDACEPILGPRALLRVLELGSRLEQSEVVDDQGKAVVRFQVIALEHIDEQRPVRPIRLLAPQPLKGYDQALAALIEALKGQGFEEVAPSPLAFALLQTGSSAGQYSPKIQVQLDPELPARVALLRVLRRLLQTMQQNLDGIARDIDTEFLHDFRVALRRTRSALGQMRHLFAVSEIQPFRDSLAEIQRHTNRLRDLDVYLLERRRFEQSLPVALRPGLGHFFTGMARTRRASLIEVQTYLESAAFQQALQAWSAYLDREPDLRTPESARRPVLSVARTVIRRRYAKIGRFQKQVRTAPTAPTLHALRIECKKLRYLLEIFASLFPPEQLDPLVKQLKGLQDVLGGLNDLHLQQQELSDYLTTCRLSGKRALTAGASIGGLIALLSADQARLMTRLEPALRRFRGRATRRLFEALLAGPDARSDEVAT